MNEMPKESWSLEQCAKYITNCSKKWAVDAWYMGRAGLIAKSKLPKGTSVLKWVKETFPHLVYETFNRWMRLAEAIDNPKDIEGIRLTEAYQLLGITKKQTRGGNNPEKKDEGNKEGDTKKVKSSNIARDLKQDIAKCHETALHLLEVKKSERFKDEKFAEIRKSITDLMDLLSRIIEENIIKKVA